MVRKPQWFTFESSNSWRASITGLICGYHFTEIFIVVVQKLDLQKVSIEEDIDCSNVKGQIVISLAGRDRGGCGPNVTDVSLMSRSDMDGCCSQISPEIIPRNNSLPHGLVKVSHTLHWSMSKYSSHLHVFECRVVCFQPMSHCLCLILERTL